MIDMYRQYYKTLCNKMIFQYVCNNARTFRVDIDSLKSFLTKMHTLNADIVAHNANYVDRILVKEKAYFDRILEDIDPVIKLDEEQRRAVITDDDHCLLVAGAGAGKTTTMAAKVKYLVEKQGEAPRKILCKRFSTKSRISRFQCVWWGAYSPWLFLSRQDGTVCAPLAV